MSCPSIIFVSISLPCWEVVANGMGRVDDGAIDAVVVHGLQQALDIVAGDPTVVAASQGDVCVEDGDFRFEVEVYFSHDLSALGHVSAHYILIGLCRQVEWSPEPERVEVGLFHGEAQADGRAG